MALRPKESGFGLLTLAAGMVAYQWFFRPRRTNEIHH
jgi:hypothetical protein